MNKITIQHVPFHPTLTPKQPVKETQSKTSFLEHLQEAKQQELKISRHASERMQERNIEISKDEWQHVTSKVMEARDKGVKQPLVLLDQAALIVSAKMRPSLLQWIVRKLNLSYLQILMERLYCRQDRKGCLIPLTD